MDLQAKFDAKLGSLLPAGTDRVAVALSGGSDSMALVLLAAGWAESTGAAIVALTVDHGLRPESAREARRVGEWMEARAIPHEILAYKGKIPSSNIEGAAREYRYDLLGKYCARLGIKALLVAHNMDEQAETFFLNLARGSGVYGLAGMPEIALRDGMEIVRPLLGFSKDELRAYLGSRSQEWVEDPSNADGKYRRVRVRNLKDLLASLELSPERISATMANVRRAREAVEFYADGLIRRAFKDGSIDAEALKSAPAEVSLRALAKIIQGLSQSPYPPRFESLESLCGKIVGGTLGRGATLAGFKFSAAPNGTIKIAPTPPRRPGPHKKQQPPE